ncbi:CBS domain-containing protein [Streptomyces sp. NPDC048663]|uniref:CBS domain-containing protein n=1 Tax=Streptomyces sp. NPDC048663 TaxID=3155638 RepID=UPI00343E7F7E
MSDHDSRALEVAMTGTPYVVRDVMTPTVLALRHGAAFKEIVKALHQWRVSAAPVLDDDGRVVGMVSEADLLRKEQTFDGAPVRYGHIRPEPATTKAASVTVDGLMTAPAVTVRPDATLSEAARAMARHGVRRLPVVGADGKLKGIVSRSDLLKVFLRTDQDIAREIRGTVVPHLFGYLPGPIRVTVHEGVVTLAGHVGDIRLIPVAVGWVRSLDGVVAVDCELTGPRRRPGLPKSERVSGPR